VWRVFKLAVRAAVWRVTPEPPLVGLEVLLVFTILTAVVRLGLELLAAGTWHSFNPYGLNAIVAGLALELAVAALFVRPGARATALSAMLFLSVVAQIVTTAIKSAVPLLAPAAVLNDPGTSTIALSAIYALAVIWWVFAMMAVLRSLQAQSRLVLVGRVAALWLALLIADALIPYAPVFPPPDFDARGANWWEVFHAMRQEKSAVAETSQIDKAQAALLQAELARLAPRSTGTTDIYALGIAGWAEQDVFIKELDGGLAAITHVLPIKDRTVRLINNRETLDTVPLANLQNFTAAVHAIGGVMDKNEDVLVLLMTSHGSKQGFMLQLPGAMAELTPQQVASVLDSEGIKNRVVIVSACYAGIFLPALANDTTIVITAADAQNTSFGCAAERDWTYFGDAFFRQSLLPGTNFEKAFDHARALIQGWELMDHAPPSNPLAHFGPALVAKLGTVFAATANAGQ
jgi:hypothetical protein